MLRTPSMIADQKLAKPSDKGRVPMTAKDMIMSVAVMPKIEYLRMAKFKVKMTLNEHENKSTTVRYMRI
jgi:hypothetical protein